MKTSAYRSLLTVYCLLLATYSRCVRITRDQKTQYPVNSERLLERAEKELYAAYQSSSVKREAVQSVDDFFTALLP